MEFGDFFSLWNLDQNGSLSSNAMKLFLNRNSRRERGVFSEGHTEKLPTCILRNTKCTPAASLLNEEGVGDVNDSTTLTTSDV